MDLARFAIEKRLTSALFSLLILAAGFYAYSNLPRFEDPEFVIRQAQIVTPYPGGSVAEVADEVTDVIENALQQLQGVDEVRSVSSPGLSTVTVEFTIQSTPDYPDLYERFAQLRAKIDDAQTDLPPNAQPSQVFDDFGDVFAQYYAIVGDGFSLTQLHEYAEELQRELVTVPGVSKVVLSGIQDEVIYVEYEPARLTQLGLSTGQIAQVLEGQNLVTPAGSVVVDDYRVEVRPTGAVSSVEAIEQLVLSNPQTGATFRLSDIATVSRGLIDPPRSLLYRDGRPAIGLGISNTLGGNVVEMGEAVQDRMAALLGERPIGIEVLPISEQSVTVKASVNDFVMNVIVALAIVVGTLLIFMGLRSGVLMGGILLVTVAGTLFGMYLFGLDMQRISLGALIIALGMLVDNAIVVVEGTLVRVQDGDNAADASTAVVNQTKWPLLGGTIVGILAFSPIGLSPDNTGEYAGSLFWTIMIALLFSWLVAIWLTPYYCTVLLKAERKDPAAKENAVLSIYRRVLKRAIRARVITIAVVVALFGSALAGFGLVPPGFFPASTRAQFVVDYSLPYGTDIARTQIELLEIDEYVRTLDGVTGTNTVLGGGHSRFMLTYDAEDSSSSYGQILVDVENFRMIGELQPHLKTWINDRFPGSHSKVWQFTLGPGGGALIEARFSGPDQAVLRDLSRQAQTIMADAGAVAIQDDWREQIAVVRPIIDTENARRLGLTQADIASAIYAFTNGANLGVYREDGDLISITMRPTLPNRDDIADLQMVEVYSQITGGYIPVGQVVDRFEVVLEGGNLRRIDRQFTITAQSDPAPGVLSGDLFDSVRGPIEDIALPPGYALEWRGEFGGSQDANAGLAATMPLGFGAMVLVVVLLFNAIRQPVIIWLTVPLALIGVVWGLAISGTPLEFMAILGILSLTGMLIKNAIVLIDETDSQIGNGKARMDAVLDAAVSRVRPVVLGVLTTVLGVIPLLWDPFFQSLAVVIITGLSFATVLTLIVVPTLYTVFFRVGASEVGSDGGSSTPTAAVS